MSKQKIEYPVPATLKVSGEDVQVAGEVNVCGIKCYRVETKRGKYRGDYAQSKVTLRPSRQVRND